MTQAVRAFTADNSKNKSSEQGASLVIPVRILGAGIAHNHGIGNIGGDIAQFRILGEIGRRWFPIVDKAVKRVNAVRFFRHHMERIQTNDFLTEHFAAEVSRNGVIFPFRVNDQHRAGIVQQIRNYQTYAFAGTRGGYCNDMTIS